MEDSSGSVSTQDDGTVLYRDGGGNVVYAQDQAGNPISIAGAAGSGIIQQVAALLNYGVRSAIDSKYRQTTTTTTATTAAATAQAASTNLLILAGLAFLAYKILAK